MFHEVRILDAKGKQKKVLSSKLLSKRYWGSFFESTSNPAAAKKSNVHRENKPGNKTTAHFETNYYP